ncbi:MAG: hypothetical protein HJJLKODD_00379 [Phycisphaerae bacterium]|nr:hypothetical protein [Phycisphaerae bacterium]
MEVSRRQFISNGVRVAVAGSAAVLGTDSADASEALPGAKDALGMLVDLTKCIGCRQCEAACQRVHGFEVPTPAELLDDSVFQQQRRPDPRHLTVVNRFDAANGEVTARPVYAKINCLHCQDPACVSACLVGAMHQGTTGAVLYDPWKCMGCRYCMVACPFQIPVYEYNNAFTPQVRKCQFCANRGNPQQGELPACMQACPRQCLVYGKRQDLLEQARQRIEEFPDTYLEHIYGEHEAGGTSWLYLSSVPFEQLGFLPVKSASQVRVSETIQHGVFKYFIPPLAWLGALGVAMWLTHQNPPTPDHLDKINHPTNQHNG